MNAPQAPAWFIAGTDTEVGKTRVSAGLLHWLAQAGWRAAGYKPVAAGMEMLDGRLVNEDVLLLQRSASVPLTDHQIGPCQLEAARRAASSRMAVCPSWPQACIRPGAVEA